MEEADFAEFSFQARKFTAGVPGHVKGKWRSRERKGGKRCTSVDFKTRLDHCLYCGSKKVLLCMRFPAGTKFAFNEWS